MTTTNSPGSPVPQTPAPAGILSTLAKDYAWVVQHLLLLVCFGAFMLGSVYFVESRIAAHDALAAQRDQQILATQQQTVNQTISEVKSQEANWQKEMSALLAANQQLSKEIAVRNTQLAQQVKIDATLSAQQAAARIAEEEHAQPSEVTASGDTVTVDLPVARSLTADLDRLPVVSANLTDTQQQLANETQIAANSQSDVTVQKVLVAQLQKENTDQKTACDAEVKSLKAKNRKRNWKYFLFGGAVVEGIRIYFTRSI